MTYEELINQIRDLGFGDDSDIEDFEEQIPNKINLAIAEINQFVGGCIGTYEIEVNTDESTKSKLLEIDMKDIDEDFIEMGEVPIKFESLVLDSNGNKSFVPTFSKFNDYEIKADSILYINADGIRGKLRLYYKKEHPKFDMDTSGDAEIELPKKVHVMIPLLASYYIWLEDDPTKAIYYYNRYETLVNQSMAKMPRVRIGAGGI